MADDLELEEFWQDLRPRGSITTVSGRPTDLKSQLLLASEQTAFEVAQRQLVLQGQFLTADGISKIVADVVQTFFRKWLDNIRSQNLSGLIAIVLEGQKNHLTPEEMLGFIRALPESILDKILDSAINSGTGVDGLIALEKHRRRGGPDYNVETVSGEVIIRFFTPEGREVQFGLYESFDLKE